MKNHRTILSRGVKPPGLCFKELTLQEQTMAAGRGVSREATREDTAEGPAKRSWWLRLAAVVGHETWSGSGCV